MAAHHGAVARATAQQALEQSAAGPPRCLLVALGLEQRVHLVPGTGVHEGFMLACVHLLAVANLAEIGDIREEPAERAPGKSSAAAEPSRAGPPALGAPAPA